MKYTIDESAKTIELHQPMTITEIVALVTTFKKDLMEYKVIGHTPPFPIYNPTITWGTVTGDPIPPYFENYCTSSDNLNIKSFKIPGGIGFAVGMDDEEE